jgi:hypothetical protein
MSHTQHTLLELNNALVQADLGHLSAELADDGTCYLMGEAHNKDEEAGAVQCAFDVGAELVIDGIHSPEEHLATEERPMAIGPLPTHHLPPALDPGVRILAAADLSDRTFDVPTAGMGVHTGVPLVIANTPVGSPL